MLKSRRGLLAAGLTVAVIGTIGVASTLNAGAEQIPDVPAPSPAAVAPADQPEANPSGANPSEATPSEDAPSEDAAEAAPKLTPPAILPWGAKPRSIRKGRDGASSKSLKAAGLSAAPDRVDEARGQDYAPKGRTSRTTFLKTETTDVVPPAPPSPAPTASADTRPTVHYLYNVASQAAESEGAYANLTISKPKLDKGDYHTLAEVAVQSPDGGHQVVEAGWTVDRVVNGDDDPHLFVFHWVDGKPACYNKCKFVQFSENIRPGDTLPQDTQKQFGIQYTGGAWWVAYDTEWVGYFPGELWGNKFEKTGLVQIFGEVAASTPEPCTEMGNGKTAIDEKTGLDPGTAAKIGSISFYNGPKVDPYVRSTSKVYPISKLSARTFRYGGPGKCGPVVEPSS
ncbi:neprosin family prolyl endopeptidase [Actinoplanes sp. GCM10030250]|uniref:neprosin family prolyl endopeptidase n=1 Tax=Actinoplanes sp. GCM10030250 TaxID=3273376 RepID=UPI003606034C